MFITGMNIENFGPFSQKRFDDISPHLTVFHGPNEAGKSAIRAFVRMVFFGFLRKNASDYNFYDYPPENGGAASGSISIGSVTRGSFTVYRRAGIHGGPVTVTGDESGGEELLATLIGRIGPEVYQNIFSVSLSELKDLGTLSQGQVRDRIYSAGLGLGSVSLPDASRALEDERGKLWSPRAGRVRTGLRELSEKASALENARSELAAYESIGEELSALDTRIDEARRDLRSLWAERERQDRLVELRLPWNRQTEFVRQIEALPAPEGFPLDGLTKFDSLTQEQNRLDEAIDVGDRKQETRTRTVALLDTIESFARNEAAIQRLLGEVAYYRSAAHDLPGLKDELREKESRLSADLETLGTGWDETSVSAPMDLAAIGKELESTGKYLTDARAALQDFEGVAQRRKEDQDAAEKAYQDALLARESIADVPAAPAEELRSREERMQQLRAAVVDRTSVEREFRDVEIQLVNVRSRTQALNRPVPTWFPLVGLAIGLVIVLWAVVSGQTSGVAAGLVLAIASGALLWLNRRPEKTGSVERDDIEPEDVLRSHRDVLQEQVTAVNGEIKKLLHELQYQDVPSERGIVESLSAIGQEARQREEYDRLAEAVVKTEGQLNEAGELAEKASVEADDARDQVDKASGEWASSLRAASLSITLDPLAATAALGQIQTLREQVSATETLRRRVDRVSSNISDVESRLSVVIADASLPGFLPEYAVPALEHLESLYRDHKSAVEQAGLLNAQDGDWESERSQLALRVEETGEKKASLLSAARCSDEDSFRALGVQLGNRRDLERDLEQLRLIQPLLISDQGESYREALEATLDDEVRARAQELQNEIEGGDADLEVLLGDKRSLEDRRRRLEESNPTGEIQLEIGQLQERVYDDAHRWAVLTIARCLLEESKEEFQRQRQAPLLRTATRHFKDFTLGRYIDVRAVLGEERVDILESSGRVKDVNALSRGTVEQLCLALRLALIDEWAGSSEGMPVLMDDTMVNFDADRLSAVCASIVDISTRHQVLVLTCHASFIDQLRAAASAVGKPEPDVIKL
jgi:uncharacterized protein YhaN